MHHMRKMAAASAVLMMAAGLAACSAADQKSQGSSGGGTASSSKVVNVLVHDSFDLPEELLTKFTEDTGYTVVTNSAGEATVANALILAKDSPTADAFYGLDLYTAATAVDEGVVDPYVSDKLPSFGTQYVIDDAVTPIDVGDVCVNVDHQWFTDHEVAEPVTLADLAKPEYAKLLVAQNPAASSTGLSFLVATVADQGADGYEAYWQQLLAGGTRIAAGWSDAYYTDFSGADGKGDYPLVVSYSTSPAETEGATGLLEATCTRQIEYAGVAAGAKNPAGAKAFVDFMLSADVQSAIPESMYMYPIDPEIAPPAAWGQYATLAENPLMADPREVAENKDAWIKAWTALYEAQ